MNCRVGKGRPAGSIELRVSPSPSKIPYGGFSPVRLQMDRQWRPSTTSRGLSAVHIRPMRPSYTPPPLQLPGIRDPRRDYPFSNLSVQCGATPNQFNTSIQRPLARHRVMLSRRVIAYYGLMRTSESLPAAYGFAAGAAAPKENGLRWEPRESPIYSAGLCSRAASHTPATRRVRLTVSSSSVLAFTPVSRVRLPHWKFRRCRVHSFPSPQELLRPASWLALLSSTFTFQLAPTRSPSISVVYDYVDKQSIPTAGLSPASPTALCAAGLQLSPREAMMN